MRTRQQKPLSGEVVSGNLFNQLVTPEERSTDGYRATRLLFDLAARDIRRIVVCDYRSKVMPPYPDSLAAGPYTRGKISYLNATTHAIEAGSFVDLVRHAIQRKDPHRLAYRLTQPEQIAVRLAHHIDPSL